MFLSLYNHVEWLSVAVPEDCRFSFEPVLHDAPVVVYGTSITQSASASKPAMAWTNIVKRRLNMPLVNLGFSGNGLLEQAVFGLLSEIPARLFIIDCTANMRGRFKTQIVPRLVGGVKCLRSRSSTPILIVEHAGQMHSHTNESVGLDVRSTNAELRKGYEQLVREGVPGLYYFSKEGIALAEDAQTDGLHASDLGMAQYARAFIKKIRQILSLQ